MEKISEHGISKSKSSERNQVAKINAIPIFALLEGAVQALIFPK